MAAESFHGSLRSSSRSELLWTPVLRNSESWCIESLITCAHHLICESLDAFCAASAAEQIRSLVLLEPPANDTVASLIAEMSHTRQVVVCIDHFYHAELLSRACQRAGKSISVLIEIDVGRHHVGVRPGYDAQRVAQAADQLPGIQVTGVSGNVQKDNRPQWSDEAEPSVPTHFADQLKMLRHSLGLIQRHASEATHFLICGSQLDPETLRHFGVREIGDTSFFDEAPILIRGTVISRPEFDRAVINVGARLLQSAHRKSITLPPGVQISDTDQNSSVLALTDRAHRFDDRRRGAHPDNVIRQSQTNPERFSKPATQFTQILTSVVSPSTDSS